MNHILKDAIQKAQHKNKLYVDRKRKEVNLQVGDWVFLKLYSYNQVILAVRKYLKLSHKLFGSFQIFEMIGKVA